MDHECFSIRSKEALRTALEGFRDFYVKTGRVVALDKFKDYLSDCLPRVRFIQHKESPVVSVSHWGYIGAIIHTDTKTLEILPETDKGLSTTIQLA